MQITGRGKTLIGPVIAAVVFMLLLTVFCIPANALSTGSASARISAKNGAVLRSKASAKGSKVAILSYNTSVSIDKEVFTKKDSVKKTTRWYHVSASGKKGYVRADLVGSISFAGTSVKTTAKLNYRKGAGMSMKKGGTFSKGTKLLAVLPAKAKGEKTTWYKVKKGSKYSYVNGKYIKEIVQQSSSSPAEDDDDDDDDEPLDISVEDVVSPEVIYTRVPFALRGTITSNHIIQTVTAGVVNSSGDWVIKTSRDINDYTFKIETTVDSDIKFGTLPVGSYTYKVKIRIDNKWRTKIKAPFKVKKATAPKKIVKKALELAWPQGTSSSKYKYKGGSATAAFKKALDTYFPTHNSWSKGPKTGASCDVFVGTTIRASGYDPDYPRGFDEQWDYLKTSDKWKRINYTGDMSQLQSGDIILYIRNSGGRHTCIYYKDTNGRNCLIEAQIRKYYGYVKYSEDGKLANKATKFSDKKYLYVYRATS